MLKRMREKAQIAMVSTSITQVTYTQKWGRGFCWSTLSKRSERFSLTRSLLVTSSAPSSSVPFPIVPVLFSGSRSPSLSFSSFSSCAAVSSIFSLSFSFFSWISSSASLCQWVGFSSSVSSRVSSSFDFSSLLSAFSTVSSRPSDPCSPFSSSGSGLRFWENFRLNRKII